MEASHNQIVSYIWSIADDVLRDVFVRGQYRDVILPFTVLRRFDALLEDTHDAVVEEYKMQKANDIDDDDLLKQISGVNFYNTSDFTLKDLKGKDDHTIQLKNFEDYLNGYSEEVRNVLKNFDFLNKVQKLIDADRFVSLLDKICDREINLSAKESTNKDGLVLPPLSNIGMGMVFEELLRKFNEENNEEAGEHFTPRDVIRLLSRIVFEPIRNDLPRTISIYDPACGSGGMLTESFDFLVSNNFIESDAISLSGMEINPETFAICKSDLIIKGVDSTGIKKGNTITDNGEDFFAGQHFGYMITNPPYGKSWSVDKESMSTDDDGKISDPRFNHRLRNFIGGYDSCDCTPRTSDGQLLFLLDLVDKMKPLDVQKQGSRSASIHNGSSLFTGDAGSGESNARRYLIENDLVDAIIQLPNNIFYNTGIATYVWILSNKKADNRRNKVQLIDASNAYEKLRKNQGNRNCTVSAPHQDNIVRIYNDFADHKATDDVNIESKIFDCDDFRYYSVLIERPLRLKSQFTEKRINDLLFDGSNYDLSKYLYDKYKHDLEVGLSADQQKEFKNYLKEKEINLTDKKIQNLINCKKWKERIDMKMMAGEIFNVLGNKVYMDYNVFEEEVRKAVKTIDKNKSLSKEQKSASLLKKIARAMSEVCPEAEKVVLKTYKNIGEISDFQKTYHISEDNLGDYGYYKQGNGYVEYETDSNLRDTEKIPVKQDIYDYFLSEVKPYVSDAWINIPKTDIGCEISFNKYFYKPVPLRTLAENEADIIALDAKSQGFIRSLLNNK